MKTNIQEYFNLKTKAMRKTNRLFFGITTLLVVGSLMFTSCRKRDKEEEQPDQETNTVSDNANMENISSDMDAMGSEAAETGTVGEFKGNGTEMLSMTPGATVTGFGTSTITVDFGTGTLCKDGRTRSGKLFYDLSQSTPTTATYYRNPGFKLIVTSQNYVVEGHSVTIANKTITNTTPLTIPSGTNPGTNLKWSITANISVVKPNNGGTVTWSCSRTKELINTNDVQCYNGQTLPITWKKAKIKINGTASGTNAKGESYTVVATDLVRDFTCTPSTNYPNRHPFISGTLDYKPGTRPNRLFDYGNGGCDLNATVTVNGVTYAITLP
jgi:hypothetical protein